MYEPTFTNIGGMQTTPGATYTPRRIVEPPGTILTPCSRPKRCGGMVSLSTNENASPPGDKSASLPKRNATRIPRFTHGTARQVPSSPRTAERTAPDSSASSSWLTTRPASRGVSAPCGSANSSSTRASSAPTPIPARLTWRVLRPRRGSRAVSRRVSRPSARAAAAAGSGSGPSSRARPSRESGSTHRTPSA